MWYVTCRCAPWQDCQLYFVVPYRCIQQGRNSYVYTHKIDHITHITGNYYLPRLEHRPFADPVVSNFIITKQFTSY